MTQATAKPRTVFIGVPSADGNMRGEVCQAVIDAAMHESICFSFSKFSLLAKNFNLLLTDALNRKHYTHFLLLHADIAPQAGWLSKMLDVMEQTGAEILSAVVPIKTNAGYTSTAYARSADLPFKMKRLTLKEVHALPETFTHEDLVVNSGLMLIDLRAPWIGKVWFEINDDVVLDEKGNWKAVGVSEDWLFSLRARALGAKIFATRAVRLHHFGAHGFPNYEVFGKDTDIWRET